MNKSLRLLCAVSMCLCAVAGWSARQKLGLFQASTDIGHSQPGTTRYDAAQRTYTVSGGGQDIWGTADDFRYVWTKHSGDAALTADVHVQQPAAFPLAKGVLMFRQSLDPDSPYADVAIHADGHITLQYRLTAGGETKDVVLPEHHVERLRIERKGNVFTAYAISADGPTANPPSITVRMKDPVYVGIGVCSHDVNALQSVVFSAVTIAKTQ